MALEIYLSVNGIPLESTRKIRVEERKPKSSDILETVNIVTELQTQACSCK